MRQSSHRLLIPLLLVLLSGLALGLYWGLGGEPSRQEFALSGGEQGVTPEPPEPQPGGRVDATTEVATLEGPGTPNVVIWPLEIDLERVHVAESGVPARGSGADASLEGRIVAASGVGSRATLEFVAGPNRGRVLQCDDSGSFGASDLYPGLGVVDVAGPDILGSQREVRLHTGKPTLLNLGYGSPASVSGQVVDEEGQGLFGATVRMDGLEANTDESGEFYFPRVASGQALVVVKNAGYAHYREIVNLSAGRSIPMGRVKFVLRRGANLEVRMPSMGSRRPAEVHLLPEGSGPRNSKGQRTFPWHEVSPAEVHPNGSVLIEDLPPGRVRLRVFHTGAVAGLRSVRLQAGRTVLHVVDLEPLPVLRGVVRSKGAPVARARVSLEAPNRVASTLKTLGQPTSFLYVAALAPLPSVHDDLFSDEKGQFEFSPRFDVSSVYYLRAVGPDGATEAEELIRQGAREVQLDLKPKARERGELILRLSRRELPLRVQVRLDGAPRDEFELTAGETLRIGGLAPGSWRVSANWDTVRLLEGELVKLTPTAELRLPLPEGALEGQDAETQERAGRPPVEPPR